MMERKEQSLPFAPLDTRTRKGVMKRGKKGIAVETFHTRP